MQIKGLEGKTADEINWELERGGKFVVFEYCFSVILVTFKEPSSIYFVKAGEGAVGRGLGYTLLSLLLGWWGIPWGPIYTIAAVVTNLRGGKDVTAEIIASLNAEPLQETAG